LKNQELARIFGRMADALELKGEIGFRVAAYRRAAAGVADLAADVEALDSEGRLQEIPGVGEGIANKIHEYLATGRMAKYDEAVSGLPSGLFELLGIQGVGPKTVRLLYETLDVATPEQLKQAIESGKFAELPGLGKKKAENVLAGIRAGEVTHERMYLDEAFELADTVVAYMRLNQNVRQLSWAGSLRRGCETVGDIDILATGSNPQDIIRHFVGHPGVKRVLATGRTRASTRFASRSGTRQVDLRVLRDSEYGAALQYFTGSKVHNIALRAKAQSRGLKLSEYGLFRGKRRVAGRTELEVYAKLGLARIEPELREDRGELDAAAAGRLPELVRPEDIKSDLHMHTSSSDGAATREEMAEAAKRLGYTHIAIADHSVSASYAGGLSEDSILRHCDWVDEFNCQSKEFRILKSCEVDITVNGEMDYPDRVLRRLDLVIASIHQGFRKEATKRMCSALAHPLVHLVAHPTGRIIGRREGYGIDPEYVIECAAKHRKILEINAFYARLDLNDIWARRASEAGVRLAVNTDAHAVADLGWMRYGVITARRAWLSKVDVVNCLPYNGLLKLLTGIRG
jgi:DNA polymerase (family 10)